MLLRAEPVALATHHGTNGGLGGDSHTHSPAEAGNQGSPAAWGHLGACLGHDTDSRMRPSVFIRAEIPRAG
jgi:hypothetical protein